MSAQYQAVPEHIARRVGIKGRNVPQQSTAVAPKGVDPQATGPIQATPQSVQLTPEQRLILDLQARLAALEAQKGAAPPRKLTCKVSPKGAMQVNGLGRFPVTLYASQWDFLLANIETVKTRLEELRPELATKGEDQ